jgi:LPS-assembly lipoprotein
MSLPDRALPPHAGRRSWLALGLLAAVAAPGCGFHLRRPATLEFQSIALSGFALRSPMEAELRRQLAFSVKIVNAPAQAEVLLLALTDARERSVVASTSSAEVRELQLRVRLNFRAVTPTGRQLLAPVELTLARDLTFSENAALAKEHEEAELFREMQADVAAQVLRRLAAIRL